MMEDDIFAEDAMIDEVLADDYLDRYADDAYDKWRDDQCDMLLTDLQELVDKHVNSKKHGYFKDNPERFLQDVVFWLQEITKCDLKFGEYNITAHARKSLPNVTIEYVEGDKHEELQTTPRT